MVEEKINNLFIVNAGDGVIDLAGSLQISEANKVDDNRVNLSSSCVLSLPVPNIVDTLRVSFIFIFIVYNIHNLIVYYRDTCLNVSTIYTLTN